MSDDDLKAQNERLKAKLLEIIPWLPVKLADEVRRALGVLPPPPVPQ